jgi:hypothetical protein
LHTKPTNNQQRVQSLNPKPENRQQAEQEMAHALIFGASGISGWALLNQTRTYPATTTFERITAVTRRPFTLEQAQIPKDDRIIIASGVDLTKTADEVSAALREKVPDIHTVTHVFFTGQ